MGDRPVVSVCVATRNRPELLARCVRSLAFLRSPAEVVINDDASDPPAEPALRAALPTGYPWPVRVLRRPAPLGYIVGRNALARAAGEVILTLDDDAELLDAGVEEGLRVLAADPAVGAVVFAQADESGRRYPGFMQPSPAEHSCLVPGFYGYAHLVRRDLLLRLGGYRERFWAYGEEMEFCKRVWDAGSAVVYLPAVEVRHVHSPAGRVGRVRMRYGMRNALLGALYNEPFPLPLVTIPDRALGFARWARSIGQLGDLGLGWQAKEFALNLLLALGDRKPIRWRTFRTWERLKKTCPPYTGSGGTEGGRR